MATDDEEWEMVYSEERQQGRAQMKVTIDLPDERAAALASQARAAGMPTERYLKLILEGALDRLRRGAAEELGRHLDVMAADIPAETTTEQMEAALEEALAAVRPRRHWRP